MPVLAKSIIGAPVTAMSFHQQVALVCDWARQHQSRCVCVANVHMVVEAHWRPEFASVMKQADLVTPDGMPLVWMLKALGSFRQDRVAGMDLFLALCERATQLNIPIFFLGSQQEILDRMRTRLNRCFPCLPIAGMEPLPFRPLKLEEQVALEHQIIQSGAGLVFVSLGCPKQEIWMNQARGHVPAVMLGLGGVFPVYAGIHKRAPHWMRQGGLEWLFRFVQEPRRLWRRYLSTNTTFVFLAFQQLVVYYLRLIFRWPLLLVSKLNPLRFKVQPYKDPNR